MTSLHVLARTTLAAAALIVCAALAPVTASAQITTGAPQVAPPAQPTAPVIMSVNDPRNALHLTADQQKQAIGINSTFMGGISQLQTNKTMTDDQKRAKFLQIQAAAKQQFISLLTPAQKIIFDAKQQEQEKYIKGSQQSAATGAALQKQLLASLTPAQKKKIDALRLASAKQYGVIEQNKSMTDLDKGRQEQAIKVLYQGKLQTILTPKQSKMASDAYRYLSNAQTLQHLAQESGN